MHLGVISLFPEMFDAVTHYGVTGRAVTNGLLKTLETMQRKYYLLLLKTSSFYIS